VLVSSGEIKDQVVNTIIILNNFGKMCIKLAGGILGYLDELGPDAF
jgi:hypothetical protein